MKKALFALTILSLCLAIPALAEETKLGKPIDLQETTRIADLLASPEKYLGKTVRVEGQITEVCQNMGCWINIKDNSSSEALQIKVNDGEIEFPKDGAGRNAVAQGQFDKLVLTKEQYVEQLKHEAEEKGKTVDTSKITEGKTIYRLKGHGAIIR